MTQLITQKDMPTHKLIVKLEDGTFRHFYLNPRQAQAIANSINGIEQFICLPKDIDSNSPTFYPKRGAWMEKMSKEELQARLEAYGRSKAVVDAKTEAEEAEKREQSRMVRAWVDAHPQEWKKYLEQAAKELPNKLKIFNSASKGAKKSLIKAEAMSLVGDLLTQG